MAAQRSPVAVPDVVFFDDPLPPGVEPRTLLGGKAAGLVEMRQALDLPVPQGFVITTEVCRRFLASGWPAGLDAAVEAAVARLGEAMGLRFGDESAPLLVSVRSGAPISMPGMMDTLLNVGITPAIAQSMARATGDEAFAADCWLRFCMIYSDVVLGLPKDRVGAVAVHDDTAGSRMAAAGRIEAMARDAGMAIPRQPREQLRTAIEAVFRSWSSERARAFRAHEGISEDLGTAVTVQAMVFGNRDERSGTGVVFTRNPATGEAAPFGDYLARAQGEDVVAGTHAVHGLEALRTQLPEVYDSLLAVLGRLERHYGDMCDVEFTVSSGTLYILQTRIGRRAPAAAVRIAVEMAQEPDSGVDRAEAVARIGPDILSRLAEEAAVEPGAEPLGTGLAASPGVGAGVLCCEPHRAAALAAEGKAVVLAREATSPDDVHGMINAAGVVTTKGGVVSHAAVVARSWSIPAVTSLGGASVTEAGLTVGGRFIAEGETVTVDGSNGAVYLGDRRKSGAADSHWARTIREWAAELGVEPGTRAAAGAEDMTADVVLFELCRAVQLKGLCSVERAAAYLGCAPEAVAEAISSKPEFFKETPRGYALTLDGRTWVAQQLERERETCRDTLDDCYARFLPLNEGFKRLVTWWQIEGQTAGDEAFARLASEMKALHADFMPIVADASRPAPRLSPFAARFARALTALEGGDATMLASPLKESYHTLWFDFHEELIALSGRNRETEEA